VPEAPANDRLVFLAAHLVGRLVEVTVRDGSVHVGYFHTADLKGGFDVALSLAHRKSDPNPSWATTARTLVIAGADIVHVRPRRAAAPANMPRGEADRTRAPLPTMRRVAHQISAKAVDPSFVEAKGSRRTEFQTDTAISGRTGPLAERELVAWTPEDDGPDGGLGGLEDVDGKDWDQFETNKKLFGVETTFREEVRASAGQLFLFKGKRSARPRLTAANDRVLFGVPATPLAVHDAPGPVAPRFCRAGARGRAPRAGHRAQSAHFERAHGRRALARDAAATVWDG